ncbi:hypothetical protein ACT3TZ_11200 [Brachybacterium sp. AOP25-B2-12]|uniref:hypothetical protein n=1 Tax=Brachybacterium sp. AOP25-B2-12 TaxID=3457710 RepID=UPI004034E719
MSPKHDRDDKNPTDTAGADGQENLGPDDRTFMIVDTALRVQRPLAAKYVASLRRKHPDHDDDTLVRHIESRFQHTMTATGAGVGGAAALPGVGTVAAVVLTAGDGAAFAEAVAFLTLATAEIRGVDMRDPEKRRVITLGVLGGEKGAEIIGKALGKQGAQWSSVLSGVAPDFVINAVSRQARRWIRRKVVSRLGGVWAGRLIPFGIGAVIGGLGNRALARSVVQGSREIFAQAPSALIEQDGSTTGSDVEGTRG